MVKTSSSCILVKVLLLAFLCHCLVVAPSSFDVNAQEQSEGQRENRHPTYSPGGADMRGVSLYRIRSFSLSPQRRKTAVRIELLNSTGGWYVGGDAWYLWIGDAHTVGGQCAESAVQQLNTACFIFSMEQWKRLKQREPLILTWGSNARQRDTTLPFARLDKKMLDKKSKNEIARPMHLLKNSFNPTPREPSLHR